MLDVVLIIVSCVLANHLGLVSAIIKTERNVVVNCPKCASFWAVLAYEIASMNGVIESIAIAFLSAYTALWLELFLGGMNYVYNKISGKLYNQEGSVQDDATTNM